MTREELITITVRNLLEKVNTYPASSNARYYLCYINTLLSDEREVDKIGLRFYDYDIVNNYAGINLSLHEIYVIMT